VLSSRRSRGAAAGLTLLVASAVLLLAAACGGGGDGGPDAAGDGGATAGTGQNAFAAYADCMSKHGVKGLPTARPSGLPTARPSGFRTARPSGFPTAGPSGFPTVRPSGFPTVRPSGFPTVRPSGLRGGGPRGAFGRPAGVDDATWQRAVDACRSALPSFGPGGQEGRNGPFAAYRNCLNDHGVPASDGLQGLNTADPKTAAALKACEVLRPSPTVAPSPAS
jgi:hypothetical protein